MSVEVSHDQTSVDIVTELSRRFLSGDAKGALELFHPDVRLEQPSALPHGGEYIGASGMAAMGATFGSLWDRTIGSPLIFGCGDTVIQITSQTWTSKVSGRSATVDVLEVLSVTDGLITQIRVFPQDTALLMGTLADN